MRKPLSVSAGIVLLAAGFAVASIATSGSLAAIKHTWTSFSRPMNTTTIVTTTGPSSGHGRGIEICWRFSRGHHRFGLRSRIVDFKSLKFLLRHGSKLGPCVVPHKHVKQHHRRGNGGNGNGGQSTVTVTTTVTVSTTASTVANLTGNGSGGQYGQGSGGGQGGWNNLTPHFGHHHH